MAILAGDVKLVASQVMDDVPEGGGAPTSSVIVDGASNALFNDISEMDRAGGRVNLRKVFASIQTNDTDTYLGGNVIVAQAPSDPRVAVTIFSTREVFDRRTQARDRIEAYLNKGPGWDGFLLENHVAGQRTLQLFQRTTSTLPTIGRTLYLVVNEGRADEYSQYVRITRVESEIRTFSYALGGGVQDYLARVVTCELSDALRRDFPGSPPNNLFTVEPSKSRVRDTLVADAAQYYGVASTTAPVAIGDIAASVDSVFSQLVPSAQTEVPLLDLTAGGTTQALVASGNGVVSYSTSAAFNASTVLTLGNAILPGTLYISVDGLTLVDEGGALLSGATVVGTVDYGRGQVQLATSAPTYSGEKSIRFQPAAAPIRVADTAGIAVDIESRAYNYIMTIVPPPAPGTLQVSYRAQGNWYDLRDNGAGVLKGISAEYGVGTVSYSTGTVAVTLGALPDVGSEIIYAWGGKANYFNRANQPVPAPEVRLQLANLSITPNSLSIHWNDGSARSASDNGQGKITGAATGHIDYTTGQLRFAPSRLASSEQTYTVDYSCGSPDDQNEQVFSAPLRHTDGTVGLDLGQSDLLPGTVELEWTLQIDHLEASAGSGIGLDEMQLVRESGLHKRVRDNGAGALVDTQGTTFGQINYTTGVLTFAPDTWVSIPLPHYERAKNSGKDKVAGSNGVGIGHAVRNVFTGWRYVNAFAVLPLGDEGKATVRYRTAGTENTASEAFTTGGLAIDLTPSFAEPIVPGSINFSLGGKTYFDRLGSLYYDLDPTTGAAILAGQINYGSGVATLSAWVPGASAAVALRSLLTTLDGTPVDEVTFRIPAAPVRPSSLQILATRLDGGTFNISADNNGQISGPNVEGRIDYETGVVRVRFGRWVEAAGNEDQLWYHPDDLINDNGIDMLFKPVPVFADTIKYNAVAFSYLPLDANLLGLDPVRLPQDGRVPIFRAGDFAVIGHTATQGPLTVTSGQTVDCGRERLSRVRILDGNGQVVTTDYEVDLDAGVVTFGVVTQLIQPLTIEHRIEDMAQISDVQISGRLTFTRQITHNYPPGSQISSALIAGDLRAYVSTLFDQASWNGSFLDAPSGSVATATYNDVLAPILVTNVGAITERWAIQFTSSTSFNVVGEHVGVIATGTTTTDLAPLNPATGQPYFTLSALGWGAGWATGNILRFNTVGALFPVWVVRTIQQGPETVIRDAFTLLVRGDVDRP